MEDKNVPSISAFAILTSVSLLFLGGATLYVYVNVTSGPDTESSFATSGISGTSGTKFPETGSLSEEISITQRPIPDISKWRTYRNDYGLYGFEVKFPDTIFRLDAVNKTLIHTLGYFSVSSEKDASYSGSAVDMSFAFYQDSRDLNDVTSCDYLEQTLNMSALGTEFTYPNISGRMYRTGDENFGKFVYCVKNKKWENVFVITRGFFRSSYSSELVKQPDFISDDIQSTLANQILSTFRFLN